MVRLVVLPGLLAAGVMLQCRYMVIKPADVLLSRLVIVLSFS